MIHLECDYDDNCICDDGVYDDDDDDDDDMLMVDIHTLLSLSSTIFQIIY